MRRDFYFYIRCISVNLNWKCITHIYTNRGVILRASIEGIGIIRNQTYIMAPICTLVMTSGSTTRHLTFSYRSVSGLLKSSFDLLRNSTDKSFVRNQFQRHAELSTHRSLLATSCGLDLKGNKCSLNSTGIIAKKGRNHKYIGKQSK